MEEFNLEEIISQDSGIYARWLIGRVRHLMSKERQKELVPYHVTSPQAFILFVLKHLGHNASLAELARYCGRGINTLSVQMIRLEKDGLVKKVKEVPRSKILKFYLTEKGIETYYPSSKKESEIAAMSVLSEEERQQLVSMLKRIKSALERK
jgi:DNA-binding MarR family transcriptional regulator